MRKTPSTLTTILIFLSGFTVFLFCFEIGSNNISSDSNALAQTFDKAIFFPLVNVTDSSNNLNNSLDEEFIVVNTNADNGFQIPIEVANPDFGLYPPFIKLVEGQKYTVNFPNDEDIKPTSMSIKLAPILSVSSDIQNLTDADPENPDDMTLGKPIDVGHYSTAVAGGGGQEGGHSNINSSLIVPTNLKSGNYILYVYLQYPYGITGVFSNAATITGLEKK
jgi:hypothetical protein